MIEAEQLHARILEKLDLTREVEDEELTGIIYQVLQEAGQKEYIPLKIRTALGKELFNVRLAISASGSNCGRLRIEGIETEDSFLNIGLA